MNTCFFVEVCTFLHSAETSQHKKTQNMCELVGTKRRREMWNHSCEKATHYNACSNERCVNVVYSTVKNAKCCDCRHHKCTMFCSSCFDYAQGFFELLERLADGRHQSPVSRVQKCANCVNYFLSVDFVSDYVTCCGCRDDDHCLGCTHCSKAPILLTMRTRVENSMKDLMRN